MNPQNELINLIAEQLQLHRLTPAELYDVYCMIDDYTIRRRVPVIKPTPKKLTGKALARQAKQTFLKEYGI